MCADARRLPFPDARDRTAAEARYRDLRCSSRRFEYGDLAWEIGHNANRSPLVVAPKMSLRPGFRKGTDVYDRAGGHARDGLVSSSQNFSLGRSRIPKLITTMGCGSRSRTTFIFQAQSTTKGPYGRRHPPALR
jgi:hypothetical protein